jgi:hypothetical protein
MKRSSSHAEAASMLLSVPPEIITLNRTGFERTQQMMALVDRRLNKLVNDSEAADDLPIRDMQILARMIHNLEKDLAAFAAILYPTTQESLAQSENNLESVLAQAVQTMEKMEAAAERSAPMVNSGQSENAEKFSQHFFNHKRKKTNSNLAASRNGTTENRFNPVNPNDQEGIIPIPAIKNK